MLWNHSVLCVPYSVYVRSSIKFSLNLASSLLNAIWIHCSFERIHARCPALARCGRAQRWAAHVTDARKRNIVSSSCRSFPALLFFLFFLIFTFVCTYLICCSSDSLLHLWSCSSTVPIAPFFVIKICSVPSTISVRCQCQWSWYLAERNWYFTKNLANRSWRLITGS